MAIIRYVGLMYLNNNKIYILKQKERKNKGLEGEREKRRKPGKNKEGENKEEGKKEGKKERGR